MKKGKEYELLVEQIYNELSRDAVITQDEYIMGLESGRTRQIDVTIRQNIANVELLIIVQVKDWGRKADVKVIDEFISVIRDVRASKGILVCIAGFTRKAKEYAKRQSIELYSAHTAINHKWSFGLKIPAIRILHIFEFSFQTSVPVTGGEKITFTKIPAFRNKNGVIPITKMVDYALEGRQLECSTIWNQFDVSHKGIYCNIVNDEFRELVQLTGQYKFIKTDVSQSLLLPTEYRAIVDHVKDEITATFVGEKDVLPLLKDASKWTKTDSKKFNKNQVHLESECIFLIIDGDKYYLRYKFRFNGLNKSYSIC
ncbi:restriction endonuclease [Pedobacter agri]|uniref:restriction endonuclease n=1 Tax=Pedobacter agri TaxID=454586 RepID=UPI00292F2E20|nr:restriction endonuclease [Pedobacter agri]